MEGIILPICETCEKLIECRGGKKIAPFGEVLASQKKPERAEPMVMRPAARVHNLPEQEFQTDQGLLSY